MAIATVTEAETQLCGNCKKDIPAVNFIIHEIHCRRNLEVCCYCSESIPKSEMKNHIESEHVQVTCKCRMKMENSLLKEHEASACPLRPVLCQYCDILLAFNKLQEHEAYCGARTEMCAGCGHNVLVRELKEHPRVCGQEEKAVRGSRAVPRLEDERGGLHTLQDLRTQLRSEDELEQLERNGNSLPSLYEEWNADLDYVLALSLQNGNNCGAQVPTDFWENYYAKESVPSACLNERDKSNIFSCDSFLSLSTSNHRKNDEIIMLPCEFCEELYPEEDLILHQTGCNPASAFASFSKRSSSPNPQEYEVLNAVGSKSCKSLSSSQLQAVQAEGSIIIPCEFCGIQLEEETIFHHQQQCELCPDSPTTNLPPLQANQERRDSPELARRRIRHQGDVSPWCTGSFAQQRLSCPARETKPLNNTANPRKAQFSSSVRANDAPNFREKARKASGSEGRPESRAAGGTGPCARPAQNFCAEAFTSSFLKTSPSQPSNSSGGGRSLGMLGGPVSSRHRNTEVKAQSPASSQPEK